jgi:RNA polymerase sigma-70 factor (ECF subfamily)
MIRSVDGKRQPMQAMWISDRRLGPARSKVGQIGPGRHLRDMTDLAADVQNPASIVRLAVVGDETAFAALIDAHNGAMTRVAYVVTGDWDVAREATQSAWTVAWKRLPTLRDPDRVEPWLVAIAANEARQMTRRERRRTVREIAATAGARDVDPSDNIDLLDLGRALRNLKPEDRVLIALRYVAGLDSGEIALAFGGSASGVRSRLARILDRLREELGHD